MYLKIMGNESMDDGNSSKTHTLIECRTVRFYRTGDPKGQENCVSSEDNHPDTPWAEIDGERVIQLHGNAYVVSDNGRTISSFAQAVCLRPIEAELQALADAGARSNGNKLGGKIRHHGN